MYDMTTKDMGHGAAHLTSGIMTSALERLSIMTLGHTCLDNRELVSIEIRLISLKYRTCSIIHVHTGHYLNSGG